MKKGFLKAICLVGVLAFAIPVVGYCDNVGYAEENVLCEDSAVDDEFVFAVKLGNLEKVKELIDKGADVNAKGFYYIGDMELEGWFDAYYTTPLYYACYMGDLELAKLLIENGADVNIYNEYGKSLLGDVIERTGIKVCDYESLENILLPTQMSTEVAKLLIENGADVNALYDEERDNSPLSLAILYDQIEIAKLLIENGADVNVCCDEAEAYYGMGHEKMPALVWATKNNKMEMAKLLIENGANEENLEDDLKKYELFSAVEKSNLEKVKLLIENGVDVNAKDYDGCSLIYWATDVEIVRLLIENGADVNATGYCGNTPLHIAAFDGDLERAKLLIENGADIYAYSEWGEDPLGTACRMCWDNDRGHVEVIELLLEQYCGDESLIFACRNNNETVVRLLLEHGCMVNLHDNSDDSALKVAARNGNAKIIKMVLDNSSKAWNPVSVGINDTDQYGLTALDYAILSGNREAVQLLVDNGGIIDNHKWDRIQGCYNLAVNVPNR